ncbi:hypothetical protein T11_10036 [Trichinella zimbabwensis]|uniref:Uncharacterized protein n=1 Tax=Trichinella zimbabwensis TaxID=268475 RepID=A0A0V1H5K5_9BILA|nr:hypothetical protein T11_10036 [Trichinella zimbabwensis]
MLTLKTLKYFFHRSSDITSFSTSYVLFAFRVYVCEYAYEDIIIIVEDNTDVIHMCQKIKIALSDKKASVPVNLLLQENALLHIGLSGHCAFLS